MSIGTTKKDRNRHKRLKRSSSASLTNLPDVDFETITADVLQDKDFPPLRFAIDGLIAEGLTLLAGKPKIGKSWMALDFALSVATGGFAVGSIDCEAGNVLYCALEDNQRRLQRRLEILTGSRKDWPASLSLTLEVNRLDEGLVDDLRGWITHHDARLVIIDTLACVRPRQQREKGYEADYATLAPLQNLAGELGISIVVVHHLRKMQGDDPFDMISGTTGLTGAVDAALVLHRNSNGIALYGRGREIEEVELAVEFAGGAWRILGKTDEVWLTEERKKIVELLASSEKPMGPKALAEALNQPENNIKQLLRKMLTSGEVRKVRRGLYSTTEK